jgi:murein DD-endopeptidase MepM/ murein hydrolase activator NlpD
MKRTTYLFAIPIFLCALSLGSFSAGKSQSGQFLDEKAPVSGHEIRDSSPQLVSFDSVAMKAEAARLRKSGVFRYPLDDYFPEIPVTDAAPPKSNIREGHHAGEDSFAPAGTPVYAIGDGIISYSGKAKGYGWLIIIDHPDENVYSLYGHLSTRRWKADTGKVEKGELIAYLAEAREAETMVPHIHFGLRMGQKADYPVFGDQRWMAGYTHMRPDRQGWFHASKIIGETDSMRTWHSYIRKREDMVTGRSLHASDFKITSGSYSEKDDLDQRIQQEFGDQYKLADWREVKTYSMHVEGWADSLGLAEGQGKELLVASDGYRIWLGRQFFISRFNDSKPEDFLAFDAIDDNQACLGSWFGMNARVLAVRK